MNFKSLLVTAAVAIVAVAIANRVDPLRRAIQG